MMLDAPAVRGQPRLYLQLEGGALLALSTALYAWGGAPWWIYAVFFFAPDISFLAYFVGPRTGAMVYNAMHTTLAPAILVAMAAAAEYLRSRLSGQRSGQLISAMTVCSAMA